MIDFSKALDTVDHVMLLSKLVQLKMRGSVINWICFFVWPRSTKQSSGIAEQEQLHWP